MESPAREIARRLAENAEGVCRRYLPNGRREGGYWLVGDIRGTPGRSLYVRLVGGDGGRSPGKWTDAATGDHGDLLDIVAANCASATLRETLAEARRFLSLPSSMPRPGSSPRPRKPLGSPAAARRLWSASQPIAGTRVETYLRARHLTQLGDCGALRFHPHCYYRASRDDAADVRAAWPALIAAVTDDAGTVTGVHRTWLDLDGRGKAPVACPRRAMGQLLGAGVRFGRAGPVMAFGEGIETMLSLRQVLPAMPMIAGLSAAHLAAIHFPVGLRRLYVARDDDPAGSAAVTKLRKRAAEDQIELLPLEPTHGDCNADLVTLDRGRFISMLVSQLHADDRRLVF